MNVFSDKCNFNLQSGGGCCYVVLEEYQQKERDGEEETTRAINKSSFVLFLDKIRISPWRLERV